MNATLNWRIKFDGIKPSKYYKTSITEMNDEIVEALNRINLANAIDSKRESAYDALPKCTSLQDFLSITNGHDFINLFCKVSTNSHGQASIKSIEATLRGSFGISDFKETRLFNELLTYQREKGITIVS